MNMALAALHTLHADILFISLQKFRAKLVLAADVLVSVTLKISCYLRVAVLQASHSVDGTLPVGDVDGGEDQSHGLVDGTQTHTNPDLHVATDGPRFDLDCMNVHKSKIMYQR
jgi:hypothetical protein